MLTLDLIMSALAIIGPCVVLYAVTRGDTKNLAYAMFLIPMIGTLILAEDIRSRLPFGVPGEVGAADIIVSGGIYTMSAIMAYVGFGSIYYTIKLVFAAKPSIKVNGRLLDINHSGLSVNGIPMLKAKVSYLNMETWINDLPSNFGVHYKVGDRVTIIYSKDNPYYATIELNRMP